MKKRWPLFFLLFTSLVSAQDYDVNLEGTKKILEASREAQVKRVVHCSTIGVHSDLKKIPAGKSKVLGRGFNGNVMGVETVASRLLLDTFEMTSINTGVTYSDWQNHASVGMEVMRNYTVVLNYCKSYAGFRKVL